MQPTGRHPIPPRGRRAGRRWAAALLAVALLAGACGSGGDGDLGAPDGLGRAGAEAFERARPTTTAPPRPAPATTTPPTVPAGPQPYAGPVRPLSLQANVAGEAQVATAAVPTVSVYAEPLTMPAPELAAWQFPATTLFGNPTTFLVTARADGWVKVMLPMKPNGTEGWVHASEVTLSAHARRLVVDLAARHVTLYDGDAVVTQSVAVIGKPSTPTPTGTFYVTDLLRTDDPGGVYGPYIVALSARSDSFEIFNGGEPIVALHGTNQPSLLGSAASAGCVRLPNEIATELVKHTPLGTPVFIV